ncbi:MAG: hypothetical protein JRH20_11475 [Deltaproteobacteria bacterium]|nr:hypothetical protein [Deltaproteobacteria bacterium]
MSIRMLNIGILLAGLFGGGCAEDTTLLVNIQALPGVHDEEGSAPVDLLVTFQSQKAPAPQQHILSAKGNFYTDVALEQTRFVVLANEHGGPVSLTAEARGKAQRPVGFGVTTAMLAEGEMTESEMLLYPSDMQVNTQYANTQVLTLGFPGRQVASDQRGNFIALWREIEPCNESGGTRCDIFGRLYDSRAIPRVNGAFGNADQFVVNPNTVFYGHPTVAMQPDGSYLVAWIQGFSDRSIISIRSFMPDGTLDANMSASEITLSTDVADVEVANPDVAALPNGNYFVAWVETMGPGVAEVRSRIVTRAGTPADGAADPATAARLDPIPAWLANDKYYVDIIGVGVAAGPEGGAMVAWSPPCDTGAGCWDLRARAYVHGTGYSTVHNTSSTGSTGYFDLASLPYGYALTWGDKVSSDPNEGMDIILRRFGREGNALDEDGVVINTSRAANQDRPSLALHRNGTMLVAWYTGDENQDPEGGIRARRLMANGLPVGQDFGANTTTTGLQSSPSLEAGANNSFIMLFEDESAVGPDKLSSGIRLRLLYPDYEPRDKQVGSLCTAGECQSGHHCMALAIEGRAGNELRCVNECDVIEASCPNGGRCLQLPDLSKYVCVYNTL